MWASSVPLAAGLASIILLCFGIIRLDDGILGWRIKLRRVDFFDLCRTRKHLEGQHDGVLLQYGSMQHMVKLKPGWMARRIYPLTEPTLRT